MIGRSSGIGGGGEYGHHGSGLAAHLAGAMVTGAAGTYRQVAFDTLNDDVAAVNASLDGAGTVTVTSAGAYCVGGVVHVTQVLLMTGAGVQVKRSGVIVAQIEATGLGLVVGGLVPLSFCLPLDLAQGATVEVWVASFTAGGAAVLAGRDRTFLSVAAV